ncbi:hypothetical protein SUNI508_02111 [Seiridium unicorne]|uniref:Uncharacterized protein n=1 Tax=Seiridium unicorne TaxID=138068 RepID=A0ABR2UKW9_9PEZI
MADLTKIPLFMVILEHITIFKPDFLEQGFPSGEDLAGHLEDHANRDISKRPPRGLQLSVIFLRLSLSRSWATEHQAVFTGSFRRPSGRASAPSPSPLGRLLTTQAGKQRNRGVFDTQHHYRSSDRLAQALTCGPITCRNGTALYFDPPPISNSAIDKMYRAM